MWWLCVTLVGAQAWADAPEESPAVSEDAEPPPDVIDIPEDADPDEAMGSALEDPTPIVFSDDDGLGETLDAWRKGRREVWSTNTFVRPSLSLLVYEDVHPMQLGISGGKRWWQLRDGLSMSVTLLGSADVALAGGRGSYATGLSALAGPWFHVIGLQLGPGIGADRWDFGGPKRTLAASGGVDLWALLVLDVKLLHVFGGVAPRWLLSDRPAAGLRPLDGVGDELTAKAGVAMTLGSVRLSLDTTRRWTHLGSIDRFGLGLRFRLL
jgi:hypothetical protein